MSIPEEKQQGVSKKVLYAMTNCSQGKVSKSTFFRKGM